MLSASSAHSIAWQMSSTCVTGRHGVPSLVIAMRPVVQARAQRSLMTMSKRMRGDAP